MRFENKVCIVTGGSSGIGRAVSVKLGNEAANVVVVDIDEDGGRTTLQMMRDAKKALFVKADVSSSSEVGAVIDCAIKKWGCIDILVNNAAIMTFKSVTQLSEEEWDRVINVNLRGAFLLSKYALPHMRGGAIVNVSSIHAHQAQPNVSPYAASKGALEAFTRALSLECKSSAIRVNCIAPGGVNTPMLWTNPSIAMMNPQNVIYSEPNEIAEIICFLASDASTAINGATIIADRGIV